MNRNVSRESPSPKIIKVPGEVGRRPAIPETVKYRLWAAAAGRCQYTGCNRQLWKDGLTLRELNASQIAHIISWSESGPRGDARSSRLAADFSNLMLMCYEHHRLIDVTELESHTEDLLLLMKQAHEERIRKVSDIQEDMKCLVLTYSANIGAQPVSICTKDIHSALLPEYYPIQDNPISLGARSSLEYDHEDRFWESALTELERAFNLTVRQRLASGDVHRVAVFGLAPQPLLIKLGSMLSEIQATEIYQRHRDPVASWKWTGDTSSLVIRIETPADTTFGPALVIALSATVTDDRIRNALDGDASIWRLTVDQPRLDLLKSREHLMEFRKVARAAFNEIKAAHGQNAILRVFPAMPNSAAIEFGRCWNSKAEMSLRIYDQNAANGGFVPRIYLNHIGE